MVVIDGKKIAEEILNKIREQVMALPFVPVFCDILVGDNPVSVQYVKMKAAAAERVGMKFLNAKFSANITTDELTEEIKKINQTPNICGLIAQLPLPEHIDKIKVLNAIEPRIDVDCIGEVNMGLFYSGRGVMEFPTAMAIMKILDNNGLDLKLKKNLILGFGQLVGRPVSFLFKQRTWEHTVADNKTENIDELIKNADCIISAVGKPDIITGEKIKPGSIIIDAGTSEGISGSVVGDVNFASVSKVASVISPVPGGVGPVTVACLLGNVCEVAKQTKIN